MADEDEENQFGDLMATDNVRLDIEIHNRIPFGRWQIVDVEFAAADTDFVIPHDLEPSSPYDVHYTVLRQTTTGVVYEVNRGETADAKAWESDYIVLRSDVANWKGRLLLTVLKRQKEFSPLDL